MTRRVHGAKKSENLRVRIDYELIERVARAAAAEDRSVASFVRLALLERLGRADFSSDQKGG